MPFRLLRLWADDKAVLASEPTCGNCGYCVRGIAGLICPECGSDLREVGIISPGRRRYIGPAKRMLIWTIALPLPALLISSVLAATVVPYCLKAKGYREISCSAPYLTSSLFLFSEQQVARPGLWSPRRPAFPENAVLYDRTRGAFMDVNLKTGAYSYQRSDGTHVRQPTGFNGAVLADWFATTGVNKADPRVRDLCDKVCTAVTGVAPGKGSGTIPLNDRGGHQIGIAHSAATFNVRDEPSPAVVAAFALLWVGIWLYGLRRISAGRSGERRSRPSGAPPVAQP